MRKAVEKAMEYFDKVKPETKINSYTVKVMHLNLKTDFFLVFPHTPEKFEISECR